MNRSNTPKQVAIPPPKNKSTRPMRSTKAGGYQAKRPQVEGGGEMRGVQLSRKGKSADCC